MDKKERALHHLESEMDSIAQSIYCNPKCCSCQYLRRIHAMQGKVRILMDYGNAPKNTTLTTFQIKKYGAGTRRATHSNHRTKVQPHQTTIGE